MSTTCQQNNWCSAAIFKIKIIHSPVISYPGDRTVQRMVLSVPSLLIPEGTTGEIKTTGASWRRGKQVFTTLLQPVLLQPGGYSAGRRGYSWFSAINRNPQMHLAPPVCLLLQEGIQFSKGCARSRDAGWVGVGLMDRRQAGKKDMWEWTHGFLPGRSCEKRKNNNIDKEDKQIKLTKRNVINVRKMLYKHSGCGWGVMSPEKNIQKVQWEGGDSVSEDICKPSLAAGNAH